MELLTLWIVLLFAAVALLSFSCGVFCDITMEAEAQARRRAAEAQRLRETMQRKLPLVLLCLLSLATSAWAAPRPKPKPRPTPEQEFQRELQRFPSMQLCRAYLDLSNAHLLYLDRQARLHPHLRADISEYREQVVAWQSIWFDLYMIRCPQFVESDRDRLARIRAAIGEEAYAIGFLWPPVAAH